MQYAKVAEYQRAALVHFHALIRLDGPRTADGFAPAPDRIDPAAPAPTSSSARPRSVRLTGARVDRHDPSRILAFGRQVDARPVRSQPPHRRPRPSADPRAGRRLPGEVRHQVRRPTPAPGDNPHHQPAPGHRPPARLARRPGRRPPGRDGAKPPTSCSASGCTCSASAATSPPSPAATRSPSARCAEHAAAPRPCIAEARDSGRPLDLAALEADLLADDEDDTTLVIGHWSYAGSGWGTDAERVLALAAAARAREHAREAAKQSDNTRTVRRPRDGTGDRGSAVVGPGRERLLGDPGAHDLLVAQRRHRSAWSSGRASGCVTGRRTSVTGWRRCRRRSWHEAARDSASTAASRSCARGRATWPTCVTGTSPAAVAASSAAAVRRRRPPQRLEGGPGGAGDGQRRRVHPEQQDSAARPRRGWLMFAGSGRARSDDLLRRWTSTATSSPG